MGMAVSDAPDVLVGLADALIAAAMAAADDPDTLAGTGTVGGTSIDAVAGDTLSLGFTSFNDVAIGAIPFVFAMLAMIVLLISLPSLATWLPNMVYH